LNFLPLRAHQRAGLLGRRPPRQCARKKCDHCTDQAPRISQFVEGKAG
jgi:hypothetical protein